MDNNHSAITDAGQPDRCLRKHTLIINIRRIIGISLLGAGSCMTSPSVALEFLCEGFGDNRQLLVEIPGDEHLCEVTVTSQLSGERQVMWHADSDTLFCLARAYELRDKYENQWDFTCSTRPDLDGVDLLSSSQRLIFDQRLKTHIAAGRNAQPPFEVLAVRVVASTPLDRRVAKIAMQFFTDQGDFTEIINDRVDSWEIMATVDELGDLVTSDVPVRQAVMHSISDAGAVEVHTQLIDPDEYLCQGTQAFRLSTDLETLTADGPHRFTCEGSEQSNVLFPIDPADTETRVE